MRTGRAATVAERSPAAIVHEDDGAAAVGMGLHVGDLLEDG